MRIFKQKKVNTAIHTPKWLKFKKIDNNKYWNGH